MGLADDFDAITEALPSDWTDLELDLKLRDASRYVDAAVYLVTCNAQPYSAADGSDQDFRILVAHSFGHAAAAPAVHGALKLLDDAGIDGELRVNQVRVGRVEVVNTWGRPESWRNEFRRLRAQ